MRRLGLLSLLGIALLVCGTMEFFAGVAGAAPSGVVFLALRLNPFQPSGLLALTGYDVLCFAAFSETRGDCGCGVKRVTVLPVQDPAGPVCQARALVPACISRLHSRSAPKG
jgi:hypothetical protein